MIFPFNDKMGSHTSHELEFFPDKPLEKKTEHPIVCSLLTLQTCSCVSCGVKKDSVCRWNQGILWQCYQRSISFEWYEQEYYVWSCSSLIWFVLSCRLELWYKLEETQIIAFWGTADWACTFDSGIFTTAQLGERFFCQVMMKSCNHLPANPVLF